MAETTPEIQFHRFFQKRPKRERERELYRGKADLNRARLNLPVTLLLELQAMFNAALASEAQVPQHFDHCPFHFDYIDSDEPNALAFCWGGYSFIGVTIPLLDRLWDSASRVAGSRQITALFELRLSGDQATLMNVEQRIAVAVFRLQLMFIVLHEWAHVVHGHVRSADDSGFASEVSACWDGNVERQAREADADGYAAYHMLATVIDGQEHDHIASVLAIGDKPAEVRERLLLCSFIVSIASFLLIWQPQDLTPETAYKLSHPPQALRMSLLMRSVATWCLQNRRTLHDWLIRVPFQTLMDMVSAATWGMNGGSDWSRQIAFLKSSEGVVYADRVEAALIEHVMRGYRAE